MKRMTFLTATVVLGISAAVYLSAGRERLNAQSPSPELWEVGRCYRVYPHDREQFYDFRVLEPMRGHWVRAEPDPLLRRPGMAPPAPFWLNTDSLFAVQQWSCSNEGRTP